MMKSQNPAIDTKHEQKKEENKKDVYRNINHGG